MVQRSIRLPQKSFFLFGPRGTGKSTLLRERLSDAALTIDLLNADEEETLSRRPQVLAERVAALPHDRPHWIVLDEIQRVPRLLDVVHALIESTPHRFAMTGSSARKLRRGGANLLAGRAFVFGLHPFTAQELGDRFDLASALQWGTLPRVEQLNTDDDRREFLTAYARTYVREEIVAEQVVRNLDPFRHFLEVAAQANGQIISASTIARQVGVDNKTVSSYYQILEDTLLGFRLDAFARSVRQRQRSSPKFYLFDIGVARAITRNLTVPLQPSTYGYGSAFECFLITEIARRIDYLRNDFRLSYLRTAAGVEVDLIIERPGKPAALVEIKSADRVDEQDLKPLRLLGPDVQPSECYCLSLDPNERLVDGIRCLHWREGLKRLDLETPMPDTPGI